MFWAPEAIEIGPETAVLIVTASRGPGTAPVDQLLASVQLSVPAAPVQETVRVGTTRSGERLTTLERPEPRCGSCQG